MKRIIAIIAVALASCMLLNAQEHLKIKNVPIDGNLTSFIAKMKATGLKPFVGMDNVLEGTFAGMSNCKFIFAESDKTKTVFRVGVMTDKEDGWYSLKSTYKTLKENYTQKYSEGRSYEYFLDPYYEGDGYELQALRKEKCTYVTYFTVPEGEIKIEMKEGFVLITYEDAINFQKAKEERNETVSDDI